MWWSLTGSLPESPADGRHLDHGVASDPLKLARYREIARLRQDWLSQGKFAVGDATDVAMLRHLLLEVEHTWGTDTKTWLDFDHYIPKDLAAMLETKNYKVVPGRRSGRCSPRRRIPRLARAGGDRGEQS
jgi:hypothetical protein